MGTTTYFEHDVKDAANGELLHLDVGTSGYAGNGPQMYIRLGEESVLLSHEDAKKLCDGIEGIAHYLGYWK